MGALSWEVQCYLFLGPDSAGSGVNRVQVVLSGSSVRLFCFVQAKTLCMYGCMYLLGSTCDCVCICDADVICVVHDLNWCSW